MVSIRRPLATKVALPQVKPRKIISLKLSQGKRGGRKTVAAGSLKIFKRMRRNGAKRIKHFAFTLRESSRGFTLWLGEMSFCVKIAMLAGILVLALSPYIKGKEPASNVIAQTFSAHSAGYAGTIGASASDVDLTSDLLVIASTAVKSALNPPVREQVILRRVWVPITAYSSTVDQTDSTPFITASGTRTRDGIIAANFLPIGTKVKIPSMFGEKVFTVEDRMNARYWMRLDIWMPTREDALNFGLRTLPVEIVQEI